MKYGVPIGERISGKTLKKYNIPLEVAEVIRGYGSRRTGGRLSSTKSKSIIIIVIIRITNPRCLIFPFSSPLFDTNCG